MPQSKKNLKGFAKRITEFLEDKPYWATSQPHLDWVNMLAPGGILEVCLRKVLLLWKYILEISIDKKIPISTLNLVAMKMLGAECKWSCKTMKEAPAGPDYLTIFKMNKMNK